MTLDLSTYEATQDSPEIAEYKEKVKKVADEYTKRHGWCRQVKEALKEIGIEDEKPIPINVTTTMGFVISAKVKPSQLIGKTEDEQKALVAKKIGALSLAGSGGTSAQLVITPETIRSLDLSTAPVLPEGRTLMQTESGGSRYIWRPTDNGRVLHLWALNGTGQQRVHRQTDRINRDDLYGGTLCGRIELSSYSGTRVKNIWTAEDAEKSECSDCERKKVTWSLFPYIPPEPDSQ